MHKAARSRTGRNLREGDTRQMSEKSKRIGALAITAVLFVLGVVCYAAFPVNPPEEPLRVLFPATAGRVIFDHKTHVSDYGLQCADCHHAEGVDPKALAADCGDCHDTGDETYAREHFGHKSHINDFGLACTDCHEASEDAKTKACGVCHLQEDEDYALKRMDAFHEQCSGCHENSGAGPTECSMCHVL